MNDQGFGAYPEQLRAGPSSVSDLSNALGDPNEAMLAAALGFINGNGACPTPNSGVVASGPSLLQVDSPSIGNSGMFRSPLLENRWMR